jgi:hypothetical protein
MRFNWAGTKPVSLTLGDLTWTLSQGWWEAYQLLAEQDLSVIPLTFFRTTEGRGIRLSDGRVLNTNLCYGDVISRISRLAELLGRSGSVKWVKGTQEGTLPLGVKPQDFSQIEEGS